MATETLKIDLKIETGDSKSAIAEVKGLWRRATEEMKEDASGLTAHKKSAVKEAEAAIKAAAKEAAKAAKEAAKAEKAAAREAAKVARAEAKTTASIKKAIYSEIARYGTRAFLAIRDQAVEAFRAITKESFKLAVDFETTMTMISTLLDDTLMPRMGEIADRLLQIGSRTSQSLNDLSKSLYLAISSGITDIDRALELTEVAARSASAGGTQTKVSVDAMTTALNVWGKEAGNAEVIASQMFKTVVWAKTTYAQLASSLGTVASAAGMANVKTNELFGAYVAMTRAGNKTASSMTYLQNLIVKLLVPTRQAKEEFQKLGIEYGENAMATKGLSGIIEDIKEKTGGSTEALWRLTGQMRAYRALVVLAGKGNKDFVASTKDIKDSTDDLNKKYAEVQKTFTHQWKVLRSTLEEFGVRMWQEMLPEITKWTQGFSEWLKQNSEEVLAWGKSFVGTLRDSAEILAGMVISLKETVDWLAKLPFYGWATQSAWKGLKVLFGGMSEDASNLIAQKAREARYNAGIARGNLKIFTDAYMRGGESAKMMDDRLEALQARQKSLSEFRVRNHREEAEKRRLESDIAGLKKAREVAAAHGRLTRPKVLTAAERAEQAEGIVEKAEDAAAQAFNKAKSTERTRLELWYNEQDALLKKHLAGTQLSREAAQALRDRLEKAYQERKARLPVQKAKSTRAETAAESARSVVEKAEEQAAQALNTAKASALAKLETWYSGQSALLEKHLAKTKMTRDDAQALRDRLEAAYQTREEKTKKDLADKEAKRQQEIRKKEAAEYARHQKEITKILDEGAKQRLRVALAAENLRRIQTPGGFKAEEEIAIETQKKIKEAEILLTKDIRRLMASTAGILSTGIIMPDEMNKVLAINAVIAARLKEIELIRQTGEAQKANLTVSALLLNNYAKQVNEYNTQFANTITSMANTAVSNIGNGISRAFEVIVTGQGNAGAEIGKMFLDTLAGMAAQLGAFYMTAGFAALWVPPYTGAASIAGGAALMALSGLLKGASSLVGATASTPSTGTGGASVGKVPSVGSPDTSGARVPGQRMSRDGGGVVQFNFLVEADPFSGDTRQQKLRRIRGFFDTETRAAGMANPFALAERMNAKAVGR